MMAVHSSAKSSCKYGGKYFKLEWLTCMEASMRSKGFWMHSSHKFSNDAAAELALDWLCRVKLPKGPETSEKGNISVKIGLQNNKNESTLIFQIQHIWVNFRLYQMTLNFNRGMQKNTWKLCVQKQSVKNIPSYSAQFRRSHLFFL